MALMQERRNNMTQEEKELFNEYLKAKELEKQPLTKR